MFNSVMTHKGDFHFHLAFPELEAVYKNHEWASPYGDNFDVCVDDGLRGNFTLSIYTLEILAMEHRTKYVSAVIDAIQQISLIAGAIEYYTLGYETFSEKDIANIKQALAFHNVTWQGNIREFLLSAVHEYEKFKSKPGFVYLIKSVTGHYKIGRTKAPQNRMKTFGILLPFEVEYECLIKTGNMHLLESELHEKFSGKRINGEWFNLDESDVNYIKSLVKE